MSEKVKRKKGGLLSPPDMSVAIDVGIPGALRVSQEIYDTCGAGLLRTIHGMPCAEIIVSKGKDEKMDNEKVQRREGSFHVFCQEDDIEAQLAVASLFAGRCGPCTCHKPERKLYTRATCYLCGGVILGKTDMSGEMHDDRFEFLINSLPENRCLIRDSGLWEIRDEFGENVFYRQSSSENFGAFISRCFDDSNCYKDMHAEAMDGDNDLVACFLEDICTVAEGNRVGASDLYMAFTKYCEGGMYPLVAINIFAKCMLDLGNKRVKIAGKLCWQGVSLAEEV